MIDPFSSNLPLYHPKRLFFKISSLVIESFSKLIFKHIAVVRKPIENIPKNVYQKRTDLSVKDEQADYLLYALSTTEAFEDSVVVEIGAYRGETTTLLAAHTKRNVIAVDKYFEGWPMAENAYKDFKKITMDQDNVILERKTSAEAIKTWAHPNASLIFIDAQHNFINTSFDIKFWLPILKSGGLLALHDIDQKIFPGTRLAAWLAGRKLPLWAHIEGLIIFKKP